MRYETWELVLSLQNFIKKESKSRFDLVENEFAKPQLVFHISGETVKELLDSIQANDSLIIDRIKSLEISKYQQELKNDTLLKNQKLKNKYRILLDIPAKYKLVLKILYRLFIFSFDVN